ncbi:MAG: hypothetical protein B2I17_06710 [Thermoplasmatales archaeon B_DKE]|nr:MAG: hypothetical protein B2I17_06710 [Thermoplasmatales archaeon B_DKE]
MDNVSVRIARKIINYQTQNKTLLEDVEKLKGVVNFNSSRREELLVAIEKSNRILKVLRH